MNRHPYVKVKVTPCDRCASAVLDWDRGWFVSDKEWLQVIPAGFRSKTLCPWCFIFFARQRGRQYRVVYSPMDRTLAVGVEVVK